MNIWEWTYDLAELLEKEEPGLARDFDRLPTWVLERQDGRVDAVVPGLVAGARRLKLPWLEVFARHWHLQSMLFKRYDVTTGLAEAIDLLDRAHQEDTEDCPQSVCVAQDVGSAYGMADGPGYAEARRDVADETLARIDPSWPCWICISSERAGAMIDLGQFQAALDYIDEQCIAVAPFHHNFSADFVFATAEALAGLGRFEEALTHVEEAEFGEEKGIRELERSVYRAWLLAKMEKYDESLEALPGFQAVKRSGDVLRMWAETLAVLSVPHKETTNPVRHLTLMRCAVNMAKRGCRREALDTATDLLAWDTPPAIQRAVWEFAMEQVPHLAHPESVAPRVVALEPPTADATPEVYRAWGFPDRAVGSLKERFQVSGSFEDYRSLLATLLEKEDTAAVLAATDVPLDGSELGNFAAYHRAKTLRNAGRTHEATELLLALFTVASDDFGPQTSMLLSRWLRDANRHEEAVAPTRHAMERLRQQGSAENKNPWWDAMVMATLIEEHAVVKEIAADLGLSEWEGEIPDESWGSCRLNYPDVDKPLWATRTGPVTARVISMFAPGKPVFYGARVIFEPIDLDPDGESCRYEVVKVTETSSVVAAAMDGVHPGDEAVDHIFAECRSLGVAAAISSGDSYMLTDPETGEEHKGIYMLFALKDFLARPLRSILGRVAVKQAYPLVWPSLLEILGSDTTRHDEISKEWNL